MLRLWRGNQADGEQAGTAELDFVASILVATGEHWLRSSFGQPGLPQSFFMLREIVGPPRAYQVFESGNTQRWIELPQPSHCLLCLLRSSGHCIDCGGDA
jgi:hypothetical protein